jgi:hypothetical protein
MVVKAEGKQTKIDERLFSRAAEAAVIGSMILDPECIGKISAGCVSRERWVALQGARR